MKNSTPTLKIKDIVLLKQYPEEYFKKHYNVERKSYSHKPHLADLPYDLNTNDVDKLKERLDACNEGLKESQEELEQLQNLKKDIESVEQYKEFINEESEKQFGWVESTWYDVQKEAEEFDDTTEDGYIFDWYDSMEKFIDEIPNIEGFITDEIKDKYRALYGIEEDDPDRYADEESGYPSPMYGPWGFEAYLEDRETLQRYATNYLRNFSENGEYAKEMKARIDKLPADWEEQNKTINREIGKAETKVNDYKEQGRKIRDKMNKLGTDSQLVELPDGQIVDLKEGTGYGDLTVEDILFDPYDFEPINYD